MKLLFTNKQISLFLYFVFVNLVALAQSPLYQIYQVSGNVKLQKAELSGLQEAKKNNFLYPGDQIILNNAEIILFDRDTNYIRLRKNGIYSTAELEKIKKTHISDNITKKYCVLLWGETQNREHPGSIGSEEFANSLGGVSRGLIQVTSPGPVLNTSASSQWFIWKKIPSASSYTFKIFNDDENQLFSKTLLDTQILISLQEVLEHERTYKWSISVEGKTYRDEQAFSALLTWIDEKKVFKTISTDVKDSLGGVIYELQLANRYEKAGCTTTADDIYRKLIANNSSDPAIKDMYKSFLQRTGIRNFLEVIY
jgi:hypothetical protein